MIALTVPGERSMIVENGCQRDVGTETNSVVRLVEAEHGMECVERFAHDCSQSLQGSLAVRAQSLVKAAEMWIMSDGVQRTRQHRQFTQQLQSASLSDARRSL